MDDRAFASATELTNEIREGRIGCVELLRLPHRLPVADPAFYRSRSEVSLSADRARV
jgi:hypothetical protein